MEITVRLLPIKSTSKNISPYYYSCFSKGSYYWLRFQPKSKCTLKSGTKAFNDKTITINSLALRSPEISTEKPSPTKRILFVGDSFTTGWTVKDNESFPIVTGNLLNDQIPNQKIEVVNAGSVAAGVDYYYLYLKNEGLKLNPDVIVIGFFIDNDIDDLILSNWLESDENGLPIKAKSSYYFINYKNQLSSIQSPLKDRYSLIGKSAFLSLITDNFIKINSPIVNIERKKSKCLYLNLDLEECQPFILAKKKAKTLFLAMKKLADDQNTPMLVALLPSKFQVYPEAARKGDVSLPLTPEEKSSPNKKFTEFLKENGIAYIDLLDEFRNKKGQQLFYVNDDHWNAKGHFLAGQIISQELVYYLK